LSPNLESYLHHGYRKTIFGGRGGESVFTYQNLQPKLIYICLDRYRA